MTPAPAVDKPAGKDGTANIKLELPADAQLYVDGNLVPGTGATRSLATPKLPAAGSYAYDMTAEVTVNGTKVREDVQVVVHAGDDVSKSFGKLLAAVRREQPTAVAKK